METIIRNFRNTDYRTCRDLWIQLTERHRLIYGDSEIGGNDPGHGLDAYLANPGRRSTWVAEVHGVVVGMSGLLGAGDEAEVEPAIVAEDFRSQGIGRALIARVVEDARRLGIRFLSVKPVARNEEAFEFFVNNGFDIVGQVELFQDLQPEGGRDWREGIKLHGRNLRH